MANKLQPQKEIIVDGEKYIVQLYTPTFGLTLYAKLIRLLGEPVLKLVEQFQGKDLKNLKGEDVDLAGAGSAIQSLFLQLKDEDFVPLIQQILSSTFMSPSLQNVNEVFETHFSGRYNHVFKLVAKTLGAQYPDFLSGIGKRLSAGRGAQVSAQKAEA